MRIFMRIFIILFLSLSVLWGCSSADNESEKYQSSRNQIIDVKDKLIGFNQEDVFLKDAPISVGGNFVILRDYGSNNKFIHLFSRSDYSYITSFGERGEGPGEIVSIGDVMVSDNEKSIYAIDYGHYVVYEYEVDSILSNANYKPTIKSRLDPSLFPSWITFFSDTLAYGKLIIPKGTSAHSEVAGKWNLQTGEVVIYDYQHPDVEIKRIMVGASQRHGIYVEANNRYDLMSIFDLHGNLKYNVYGPNWDRRGDNKQHFRNVVIYKNRIIAMYDGELYEKLNLPRVCHVFDLEGNYIKTLDMGAGILRMSVDEENDRLIFCFNDAMQFAYLDLKEVL